MQKKVILLILVVLILAGVIGLFVYNYDMAIGFLSGIGNAVIAFVNGIGFAIWATLENSTLAHTYIFAIGGAIFSTVTLIVALTYHKIYNRIRRTFTRKSYEEALGGSGQPAPAPTPTPLATNEPKQEAAT